MWYRVYPLTAATGRRRDQLARGDGAGRVTRPSVVTSENLENKYYAVNVSSGDWTDGRRPDHTPTWHGAGVVTIARR